MTPGDEEEALSQENFSQNKGTNVVISNLVNQTKPDLVSKVGIFSFALWHYESDAATKVACVLLFMVS